MVALEEPEFELSCDWQGMFSISGNLPHMAKKGYPYYKECNGKCFDNKSDAKNRIKDFLSKKSFLISDSCLEYEKNNLQKCHLHTEYHYNLDLDYKTLYPHFNFGAILLKENLCEKFGEYFKIGYDVYEIGFKPHCALEYVGSYILKSLSNNWKPFKQGFNFLSSCFPDQKIHEFLVNRKISLIHYPGGYSLTDMKTDNFSIIDKEYQKIYGESLLVYL